MTSPKPKKRKEEIEKEARERLREFAESVLYNAARGHEHTDLELDRWWELLTTPTN